MKNLVAITAFTMALSLIANTAKTAPVARYLHYKLDQVVGKSAVLKTDVNVDEQTALLGSFKTAAYKNSKDCITESGEIMQSSAPEARACQVEAQETGCKFKLMSLHNKAIALTGTSARIINARGWHGKNQKGHGLSTLTLQFKVTSDSNAKLVEVFCSRATDYNGQPDSYLDWPEPFTVAEVQKILAPVLSINY